MLVCPFIYLGDMTMGLYEEDCEFADPFVSFTGRKRFKQNVSNLGSFMEEVKLKIVDWKEDEVGAGILAHCCVILFHCFSRVDSHLNLGVPNFFSVRIK